MISRQYLLGLNLLSNHDEDEDKEYRHCILKEKNKNSGIRLGTPCIVNSYAFNQIEPREIKAVIPFPRRERILTYKKNLLVSESKPYANMLKTVVPKKVDIAQLDDAIAYTNEYGAISLRPDQEGTKEFLKNMNYLLSRYKFHTSIDYSYATAKQVRGWGISNETAAVPCITIFDISHCIPIFNTRKVDGIGLLYEVILKDATEVNGSVFKSSSLTMIFSQFNDNLFYLDGETLASPNKFDRSIIKYLLQGVDDIQVLVKQNRKEKENKKPKQKPTKTESIFVETKHYGWEGRKQEFDKAVIKDSAWETNFDESDE